MLPAMTYRWGSLTRKKADRKKKRFTPNMVLGERSTNTLDHQKDKQTGPRANEAWNIVVGGGVTKLKWSYLEHSLRRRSSLEKTRRPGEVGGRRKTGRPNRRCTDCIRGATDTRLQNLRRDVEGRAWWTSLTHRRAAVRTDFTARNTQIAGDSESLFSASGVPLLPT